ncbi:hypothetical protein D3C75_806170 [compost metagenome]
MEIRFISSASSLLAMIGGASFCGTVFSSIRFQKSFSPSVILEKRSLALPPYEKTPLAKPKSAFSCFVAVSALMPLKLMSLFITKLPLASLV